MSQQAMDLRRPVQIVRRHKVLVRIVAFLGLLLGAAYAVLHPPLVKSTTLIVLPQVVHNVQNSSGTGSGGTTATTGPDSYMTTQAAIAGSNPVLSAALPHVRPAMSLNALHAEIQVTSPTYGILAISARGKAATQAEATANAVAQSYVAYVGPGSPVGYVKARVFSAATNATGTSPIRQLVIYALLGIVIGTLIGVIAALVISRRDRRLFQRDEIANSIGIPVLASIPVAHPADAADWTRLLEDYKPAAVHAWQMSMAMQQLGIVDRALGVDGEDSSEYAYGDRFSLMVLSLSSDPGALALGPQLAVFAASRGIPTALVIGPQQDMNATATLRAAGATPRSASLKRPSLLRVIVSDDSNVNLGSDITLAVVLAVIDGQSLKMPDTMRTTATVIGVSAATVTAEQLAQAAVAAAGDGRRIAGILVADPESTDPTTGRIPQPVRPTRHRRSSRPKVITTEIRR